MSAPDQGPALAPGQNRLQRQADFTGSRLTRFSQVLLRHGLPGAALGGIYLLVPEMRALGAEAVAPFAADPVRYLTWAIGLFAAMLVYAGVMDRRLDAATAGWILYLLGISLWEEWAFRVALPAFAELHGLPLFAAVLLSNAAFGAAHYFTLRWKWQWCVLAALGGLALSRHFQQHGDLAVIAGLHWAGTFLNTPRLPGRNRRAA